MPVPHAASISCSRSAGRPCPASVMAPTARNRFVSRKIKPFLFVGRRKSVLKHGLRHNPFQVVAVPEAEPAAAAPAADNSSTDAETRSMSLVTQSDLLSAVWTAPCSTSSSSSDSECPSTVKKASATGRVRASGADESKYFVAVSKQLVAEEEIVIPDDTGKVIPVIIGKEADIPVPENGANEEDEESDAASDMDEAMPEPLQPSHELKLITLDSKTSLVVVDPGSFTSDSAQVTLINGCVVLQLVHGNMRLNGFEMRIGKPVKACTGRSKDFVLIEGSECNSTPEKLTSSIRAALDAKSSPKVIREISSFNNFPKLSVLLISKWDDSRLSLIKAHLSARLPDPGQALQKSFFHLSFSKNASCIGNDWMPLISHRFLKTITNESILMVTGQSESGKSVLLKRIINVIMSAEGNYGLNEKIIFVDLDPGQSEFSPPGQLTAVQISFEDEPLISRSYAHSVLFRDRIISSVSVGSVDLNNCASVYVRGIGHLMAKVREAVTDNHCAVFVNTSGFIRGLGRSLLIDAIRIVQPTDMIEIKESLDNSNDCRFDVVFGPRARGFLTDPKSFPTARPYSYVDLTSTGKRSKSIGINSKNRESQILSALSLRPDFLLTPLSKLERITVDLKNVIHFTSPVSFSVPAVVDKLHHAFVQLVDVVNEESSAENGTRGVCLTKDLNNNAIIGYGILFVSRGAEGEVTLEVATCCEIFHKVNCIVVPYGLSLPSSLFT